MIEKTAGPISTGSALQICFSRAVAKLPGTLTSLFEGGGSPQGETEGVSYLNDDTLSVTAYAVPALPKGERDG